MEKKDGKRKISKSDAVKLCVEYLIRGVQRKILIEEMTVTYGVSVSAVEKWLKVARPIAEEQGSKPQQVGRPSKYKDEYASQAEKFCKLGATDEQLADFFEVDVSTISEWKLKYPEFSEALRKGKMVADALVAESLFQRAIGYEHDSEEIKVVPHARKKQKGQEEALESQEKQQDDDHPFVIRVKTRKKYPPDTTACIYWLKNRQKDNWRDKVEHGITDKDGNDVSGKSDDELKGMLGDILKNLE
jgi:transposase